MSNRIRDCRQAAGITQKELARRLGIAPSTLNGYEQGLHAPRPDTVRAIARLCGVTTDAVLGINDAAPAGKHGEAALSQEALAVARDFEKLDSHGRRTVHAVLRSELERLAEEPAVRTKIIPLFGSSFAAGPAEPDFGNVWSDYEAPADSRADFAIRVHGDSMEPFLPDGTVALCVRRDPRNGDVGAFLLNGEFLVKQYVCDDQGSVFLLSLNRARADADVTVWHSSGSTLLCFGTVLLEAKPPMP